MSMEGSEAEFAMGLESPYAGAVVPRVKYVAVRAEFV
jgi:hypothetical protein